MFSIIGVYHGDEDPLFGPRAHQLPAVDTPDCCCSRCRQILLQAKTKRRWGPKTCSTSSWRRNADIAGMVRNPPPKPPLGALAAWSLTATKYTVEKRQPGWPQVAAMPDKYEYADVLRDYSYSFQRSIIYVGGRLAYLNEKLDEFDKKKGANLRGLTAHQRRLPGQPDTNTMGEFDVFMAEMMKEQRLYGRMILLYPVVGRIVSRADIRWPLAELVEKRNMLLSLDKVPKQLFFKSIVRTVLSKGMLDEDGLLWLNAPDEARHMSKPLPKLLVWLMYSPVGCWIVVSMLPYHTKCAYVCTSRARLMVCA